MNNWYTYIVQCKDGSLYTGITNDLLKRISKHNCGKGAKYTRSRRPVELVWHTTLQTKGEALQMEASIKKMTRSKKLELIYGNN